MLNEFALEKSLKASAKFLFFVFSCFFISCKKLKKSEFEFRFMINYAQSYLGFQSI